jgi:hypothetical protein
MAELAPGQRLDRRIGGDRPLMLRHTLVHEQSDRGGQEEGGGEAGVGRADGIAERHLGSQALAQPVAKSLRRAHGRQLTQRVESLVERVGVAATSGAMPEVQLEPTLRLPVGERPVPEIRQMIEVIGAVHPGP